MTSNFLSPLTSSFSIHFGSETFLSGGAASSSTKVILDPVSHPGILPLSTTSQPKLSGPCSTHLILFRSGILQMEASTGLVSERCLSRLYACSEAAMPVLTPNRLLRILQGIFPFFFFFLCCGRGHPDLPFMSRSIRKWEEMLQKGKLEH